jgi:integrase/recombinase XerD
MSDEPNLNTAVTQAFQALNGMGLTSDELVVSTWLTSKRSEHTRRLYLFEWEKLKRSLAPGVGLRQLSIPLLQSHFHQMNGEGISLQSQRRAHWAIRSLLKFAHQFGYLPFNPGLALSSIEVPPALFKKIMDEASVFQLLAEARKRGERDELLLRISYAAGLRVSEVCGLNWEDFSPRGDSASMRVRGKGGKFRLIPLSDATWKKLSAFRRDALDLDPVFVSTQEPFARLSERQVGHIVKSCAKAAGLSEKISPHWLRHAHATHAMAKGCPEREIQETLGHADPRTTQKYAHLLGEKSSAKYIGV